MAYKTSNEYFDAIKGFIDDLEKGGNAEAAKRMKECFDCINENKDEWRMFYKKLVFMKDEFSYKFKHDENERIDEINEAAKRVVFRL
jgi:hypothetical protein